MRMLVTGVLVCATHAAMAAPFCPWLVPGDGKSERYVNLTVVQYIDVGDDAVRIAFGGGNLGSGHELNLPVKSRAEAHALLEKMQQASRQCDGASPAAFR
ncbi:hypothetical protein ACTSKR_12400 [Chitinibacteraceae bacterium HSL-7]